MSSSTSQNNVIKHRTQLKLTV